MFPDDAPRLDVDLVEVVHQLADGVVLARADMGIVFANEAADKLFGVVAGSLVGRSLAELVPERLREAHIEGFSRYVATRVPRLIGAPPVRVPVLRSDGSELEVELSLGTVGSLDDGSWLASASIRDVSDHIALEQQLVSARYLQAMLDVVSDLQSATDERAAINQVLPALCSNLDWNAAAFWVWSEKDGYLRCVDSWGLARSKDGSSERPDDVTLRAGEGLAGACVQARRPISLSSDEIPADWPRTAVLRHEKLAEVVAFPLLSRDRDVFGVIELASETPGLGRQEASEVLGAIGQQIGTFLERIRTDEHRRITERDRDDLMRRMQAAERSQAFLLQAARILARTTGYAESLDALAAVAVPALGDICLIDVIDDGGAIHRMASRHADHSKQVLVDQLARRYPPDPDGSHPSIVAMRTGRSMWSDTMSDEFLRDTCRDEEHYRLTKELGFSSYLSVPLLVGGAVLGSITIISTDRARRLGTSQLALTESLGSHVAEVIAKARRYEREHEVAHELQASLLPAELPTLPGYDVAVRYLPSTVGAEVGGDWYDIVTLASGNLAVTVGDVSGHDVGAAAAMGQVRSACRALAPQAASPAALVDRLRASWDHLGLDRMTTLAVAELDAGAGTVRVSSAGHPPPLVVGSDGAKLLDVRPAPPFGAPANAAVDASFEFDRLSSLLLYTDGLIELRDEPLSDGLERLCAVASAEVDADLEPGVLCDRVLTVLASERSDDVALIAVRAARGA